MEPHRKFLEFMQLSLEENNLPIRNVNLHLFNDILIYSFGTIGKFEYKGKLEWSKCLLYDYFGNDSGTYLYF